MAAWKLCDTLLHYHTTNKGSWNFKAVSVSIHRERLYHKQNWLVIFLQKMFRCFALKAPACWSPDLAQPMWKECLKLGLLLLFSMPSLPPPPTPPSLIFFTFSVSKSPQAYLFIWFWFFPTPVFASSAIFGSYLLISKLTLVLSNSLISNCGFWKAECKNEMKRSLSHQS